MGLCLPGKDLSEGTALGGRILDLERPTSGQEKSIWESYRGLGPFVLQR